MRQADVILEYYENRIRDVEAGGRCSPQLREAVSRYNTLLSNMTLPQAWAIAMEDQEAWHPIDDALSAVWYAIDQEDALAERRGVLDELRDITKLLQSIPRLNTSESTSTEKAANGTGSMQFDFPSDGTRVVFQGESHPLDERQVAILALLVEADGDWRSGPEMETANVLLRDERIDRQIKALPSPLSELIESRKGKGYRLCFSKMAQ